MTSSLRGWRTGLKRGRRLGGFLILTARLPPREWATMTHILALLLTVEIGARTLPLPRLTRLLGVGWQCPATDEMWVPTFSERRQVGCLARFVRHWALAQGPCLRQSLVLGRLLRRHRPVLRVGVRRSQRGRIEAHAWLEIGACVLGEQTGFLPLEEHGRRTSVESTGHEQGKGNHGVRA